MLAALLDLLVAQRTRLASTKHLRAQAQAVLRHWELRVEAELAWLDELDALLPELVVNPEAPAGS